ncbi:MAG: hypothetical protein AAGL10_02230 [Pseudomonadota bacterium]
MLNNPSIGETVEGSFFLGRFTPPNGSGPDSAIHARALVQGTDVKSTGLSIFAHDDRLFKVRATSSTLGETGITKVIGDLILRLAMSQSKVSYPHATLISPCKKPLSFEKDLTVKRYDVFGQINLALAIQQLSVAKSVADSVKKPWCRDIQSTSDFGVYRRNNHKSEYFVALNDSGFGA